MNSEKKENKKNGKKKSAEFTVFEKKIGEQIRLLRQSAGLTLEELSEKIGISGPTLSQIETGKYGCTMSNLWNISKALGADIDFFFRKHERIEKKSIAGVF